VPPSLTQNSKLMKTLFTDSETFTKHRPTKATEAQLQAFYHEIAEEIISEGWAEDDMEAVMHDVVNISSYDSGYEIAKSLEGFYSKGHYDIDTEFIEFLDNFSWRKQDLLEANVRTWVIAHNPQPKFQQGQALMPSNSTNRSLPNGKVVYVTGFREDRACYLIHEDKEMKGGIVIAYEEVEACCTAIGD
jgi:hypothetical protein